MLGIADVEARLHIKIPQWYCDQIVRLGSRGYNETGLLMTADELVKWNNEYRDGYGGAPPWPLHLLMIGDDFAASCFAIDVSRAEKRIFLFDHGNPTKAVEIIEDVDGWFDDLIVNTDKNDAEWPAIKRRGRIGSYIGLGVAVLFSFILFVLYRLVRSN